MTTYDALLSVKNNHESNRYMFALNSQRWIVPPGGVAYIPFDAVVRSMGDPRSGPEAQRISNELGGQVSFVPARRDEIKRLSTLYGAYTEDVDAPSAPAHMGEPAGPSLRQRIPVVTVTNMDNGDPIIFPVDDPTCTKFTAPDSDTSAMASMLRQMESMRRQIATMEAQVAGQASHPTEPTSTLPAAAEVDEDTPMPVTRPRPRPQSAAS